MTLFVKYYYNNFSDHLNKIYTVVTTVSLEIQDLNVRLTNIEKQNNQHKPEASAMDISNMQRSFPFQTINEVITFEERLSQNADEYNKFVRLIYLFECKFHRNRTIEIILLYYYYNYIIISYIKLYY